MKHWKHLLLAVLAIALSGFFLVIMRPPGSQPTARGQDLPWQVSRSQDGHTLTVFGLTLGESTVRDAVAKWGRRFEVGLFQDQQTALSLEAYFRDAVVGGLNVRLVLSAQLPEATLQAMLARSGPGKPSIGGGRRYALSEADQRAGLEATIMAITYMPVVTFDAELVRQRFGAPAEQIKVQDGTHWLYPDFGLDLLLGDNGQVLLQYVLPALFETRLRAPLKT